jgi:hypothetical protein
VPTHIVAQASADRLGGLAEILSKSSAESLANSDWSASSLLALPYISLVMLIRMNLHGEDVDLRL